MCLAIHEKYGSREDYLVQGSIVQTDWTDLTPDSSGPDVIKTGQRGTRRAWKPGCTGPVKHSRRISCPGRRLDLVAKTGSRMNEPETIAPGTPGWNKETP